MVHDINDHNYESFLETQKGYIFIDFYSPTCGPCQELLPLLPRIDAFFNEEKREEIKAPLHVGSCLIGQNPKLARKYQIRSVPFCLLIRPDRSIVWAEAGVRDYFSLIGDEVLIKQGLWGWISQLWR